MRHIEVLRDHDAEAGHDRARARLTAILAEAGERREKLATQLAMADEFIRELSQELA